MNKIFFSHKSDDWATPSDIYDRFVRESGYFDPCPLRSEFDGLSMDWPMLSFVNPPFSNIFAWVCKCIAESTKGKFVVMLVPVRTDSKWFRMLYWHGCEFYFFDHRLKFGGSSGSAPFCAALVILRGNSKSFMRYYSELILP